MRESEQGTGVKLGQTCRSAHSSAVATAVAADATRQHRSRITDKYMYTSIDVYSYKQLCTVQEWLQHSRKYAKTNVSITTNKNSSNLMHIVEHAQNATANITTITSGISVAFHGFDAKIIANHSVQCIEVE
jgi:hypothetical protein